MNNLKKETLKRIKDFLKTLDKSNNFREEAKEFAQELYLELTKKPKNSLLSLELDGYPLLSSYEHLKELSGNLDEVIELMVSGGCSSSDDAEVILSKKEKIVKKEKKKQRTKKKSQLELTNIPKSGTKKFVVHVPTKGDWTRVVRALLDIGYKWHNGSKSINKKSWDEHEEHSCICVTSELIYSMINYYREHEPSIPRFTTQEFFNKTDTEKPKQKLVFPKPGTKKFIIHVPTKEDWIRAVRGLLDTGYRWFNGGVSVNEHYWKYKDTYICIDINGDGLSWDDRTTNPHPNIRVEPLSNYINPD